MDNLDKKKLILDEINRRITDGGKYTHRLFPNYSKRDGSPSWQHDLDSALADPTLREIWVMAANSSGKTFKISSLIVAMLLGDHPFCKMFNEPLKLHLIAPKWDTFRDTTQSYFEKLTNWEISGTPGLYNSKKYAITVHGNIVRRILNRENKNVCSFSSAEDGASGLVGIRPHLLLSDEPIRQDVYDELSFRTTTKDSKFCMLATVYETKHAWISLKATEYLQEKPDGFKLLTASMIDNPYVPEETIKYYLDKFGEASPQYRIRVLGNIEVAVGIVYEGIENCLVDNNYVPEVYRGLPIQTQEKHFKWAEAYDFGISAKDPFIGGFFRIWDTGEIVQEDEIVLYEKGITDWCDAIHNKRDELDLPIYIYGGSPVYDVKRDPKDGFIILGGTQKMVRVPDLCVGDKQYLAKRISMDGTCRLKNSFGERNIFIRPAKGSKIETTLPVCQDLVRQKVFKIKERCRHSYKYAKSYMLTISETTGRVSYDSPYDHWSDLFRYLVEYIGDGNVYVKAIQDELAFKQFSSPNEVNLRKLKNNYRI